MRTVLVTGATGTVGRHVVDGLRAAGARVRALTRDPASASGLPAQAISGDLADPESLRDAVDGVDAVYLMWPLFSADAAAGVLRVISEHAGRVVLLSSGSVDGRVPAAEPIARFHAEVERIVERAAAEWTILRPAGFAANSLDWAGSIRAGGVVRGAFPGAAGAWIHEADIAAVAVHALLGGGHAGRRLAITGPASLTMLEQVRTIAEVIGREVRWRTQTLEDALAQLTADGWPPAYAETALKVQEQMSHTPAEVTSTVAEVTGVAARTYRQWVIDHRRAFS